MRVGVVGLVLVLAACGQMDTPEDAQVSRQQGQAHFDLAVARVAPVAQALCRAEGAERNCDFKIVVNEDVTVVADARQSLTAQGRPVLTVTSGMIRQAQSADEMAVVLAHEAAHHIHEHLPQLRQIALAPPALGVIVHPDAPTGPDRARAMLKGFELEADALGTQIAAAAGFDPVKGGRILRRLVNSNAQPSLTHPTLDERLQTIQQVAAGSARDNS